MANASDDPKILLTGFEPFGESGKNPSAEIVRILDGASVADHRVVGVELPVTAGTAPKELEAAVALHQPEIVLSLGLANGRGMLALERVAINALDFPIPDNEGSQPTNEPVVEGGPAAYFSTLPIKAVLAAWREAGIPGYVSNTAGTYVCNGVFYSSLNFSEKYGYRAGLIHVPYLPEQALEDGPGTPSMALDLMARAVEISLEVSVSTPEDIILPAGAVS